MRAMTITAFGEADVLKEQDMPKPEPGPHDLLIEVHASGINPVDTKIRRGMHGEKPLPLIPGFDVSGIVVGMGDAVEPDTFKVGDAVYASPSLARHGAHAEYVAVDARMVAPKPAKLSHVEAAALPLVTLTAWEALHDRAKIHTGETVLVHAGGGGVGHIGVQLAKLHGCKVVTTASRPDSIALAERCGADVVLNYKEQSFVDWVKDTTDGMGLPVIFDTVGEPVFDQSLDCVGLNGRLVTIVYNENPRIVPALFRKSATLHMEFMGMPGIHGIGREKHAEILRTAAELADAGKLKPHIAKTISLEDLPDAHRDIEAGHTTGKIVVKIRD
ncbi:MAG: zinc-binding dehydrogenase [Phycisphaeraceae bacterium]